ncbi:MAG TPA: hypothetical protein ENI26_11625, partial [Methylophaga aminisulfidivorans]|nr:hypothetical protein [Methylophaga aminisulfidivorans]
MRPWRFITSGLKSLMRPLLYSTKKTSEIKDWALGYSLLIDYYLNNDKLPEAKEVMKKAIANVADNIRFLLQLASVEETEGNYTEAKKLYESILNKNNAVDIAANNLASLLTDQFESADNLQQALTLSQRFKTSTQPFFLDTYGWVNYKLGNLSEAKSALEQAVALD